MENVRYDLQQVLGAVCRNTEMAFHCFDVYYPIKKTALKHTTYRTYYSYDHQ